MADLQISDRFIALFEQNLGIILKISKAYTRTNQDLEDLINDIAFEMWKSYPKFKGNSEVSTWIYRIALNTAMNFDRNARKNKDFLQTAITFQNAESSGDGDQNLQIELVYGCIAELDEFNKAIIILYLDGYSHEEISIITGISKTNVGTRIMRIKALLKNKVTAKLEQDGIG